MEKKLYSCLMLCILFSFWGSPLSAQKYIAGCEWVGGLQVEEDNIFTVTTGGNFINSGTVHYTGVTTFTNDGNISESIAADCMANYASPCATIAGTAGMNIFDNSVASTTIQGTNPVRMYEVDMDRDIQLDNEWQVVQHFDFISGLVTTDRSDTGHFIHFLDGATIAGNTDASHVDGYAAYSGSGAFSLPTGDGSKEMPAIIVGDCASTYKAAYFSITPDVATLPVGAPFATTTLESSLTAISTAEYWDVDGATPTTIALTFDASSNLALWTTDLNNISIAGWDGTQWVDLGNTASTGAAATGGTITSTSITPDDYTAYTFALRSGKLELKVMLQGALIGASGGLMRDDLRAAGYIPLMEPYSTSGITRFTAVGDGGGETTTNAVLNANAGTPDAIVDWVWIELRNSADPSVILDTQAALVQRDGDVVDARDGVSALDFSGSIGSNYYVAVKHRNHLGVMNSATVQLDPTGTEVDFITATAAQIYNLPGAINYDGVERAIEGGINALWAGNANADDKVKYQGTSADLASILLDILLIPANTESAYNYNNGFGYFDGDVNMNGKVKYQGPENDAAYIFLNVIAAYSALNTIPLYNYDLFIEQIP